MEKGGRKERKERKRRISTDLDFDFTSFPGLITGGSISPFLNKIS